MASVTAVAERLEVVRGEIAAAARRSGRDPGEVTLVAVSKAVDVKRIREAIAAGQEDFGENRAAEAVAKWEALGDEVRWHFVGRLQRNKVRKIIGFTHMIHSLDRLSLAEEIQKRVEHPVEALVEVNITGEETKAGVTVEQLPRLMDDVAALSKVDVRGLMTMAPITTSAEQSRPVFRPLAELREEMAGRYPEMGIRHLSMGMSQDYVVAVEEGATIVRVGEAIFGRRKVT